MKHDPFGSALGVGAEALGRPDAAEASRGRIRSETALAWGVTTGFVKVWSRVIRKALTDNKTRSVFETEGCGFDPRPPRQFSFATERKVSSEGPAKEDITYEPPGKVRCKSRMRKSRRLCSENQKTGAREARDRFRALGHGRRSEKSDERRNRRTN